MDNDFGKAAEMLQKLMSDDKTKDMLMSVVGGLLQNSDDDEIIEAETVEEEPEMTEPSEAYIQSIYNSLGSGNDKRVRLLSALKPYLCERRQPSVDNAITMVQMASISQSLGFTKMFRGRDV